MVSIGDIVKIKHTYKDKYIRNNSFLCGNKNLNNDIFCDCINEDSQIILSKLFVSPSKKGYNYWKDAIALTIDSDKEKFCICRDVYEVIALKYGKTYSSVERAMRTCFENVFYLSTKNSENFVVLQLKDILLCPKNSEVLLRMCEVLVSREFQNKKYLCY